MPGAGSNHIVLLQGRENVWVPPNVLHGLCPELSGLVEPPSLLTHCCFFFPQLLDLTIDRDRPRFHVKIADFGLARMVGPTSSIAVSKVTQFSQTHSAVARAGIDHRLGVHPCYDGQVPLIPSACALKLILFTSGSSAHSTLQLPRTVLAGVSILYDVQQQQYAAVSRTPESCCAALCVNVAGHQPPLVCP